MFWFPTLLLYAAYCLASVLPLPNHEISDLLDFGPYAVIVLACVILQGEYRPSKYQFGIARRNLKLSKLWGAIVAALSLSAAQLVFRIFTAALAYPRLHMGVLGWFVFLRRVSDLHGGHFWYSFVLYVIVDPPLEELFFRGYLYLALRQNWGATRAALASSAIFALLHLSLWIFVWSLICIYLDNRGKSLLPSLFLHITDNVLAVIA